MAGDIPPSWQGYRRRSRAAMIGLVVGLPATVALGISLKLTFGPHVEEFLFPVVMTTWALIWGVLAFRLVRWPCPRCAKPWLAGQGIELGAPRKCAHCALGLYEAG